MTLTRTTASASAAVLVAGLVVATAGEANAAHTVVIKVTEIETSHEDSIGNDFPEAGDTFSFTSKLLQQGEKVGTDKGTCTIKKILGPAEDPTGAKVRCKVALKFTNKGTIKVRGTFPISFSDYAVFTIPIVGGTGRYEDATGTLKNNQITEKKTKLTLTVKTS